MHSTEEIDAQLEGIATATYFEEASYHLTQGWTRDGIGFEAVEPILRFMERYPAVEYGSPGPLVHFIERFYRRGYEAQVLASVSRRPTPHTTWLLNRLINGEQDHSTKQALTNAMRGILGHPGADALTIRIASDFLGGAG